MTDKEYIERGGALIAEYDRNHVGAPGGARKLMVDAPAAHVVEVVRCKDCAACDRCYPAKALGEEAAVGWYCKFRKTYVKPNDFCSHGERKEQSGV
jgi:hypothetical protein